MDLDYLDLYQNAVNNLNWFQPLLYFLMSVFMKDSLNSYHQADMRADHFKATFTDKEEIFDFIVVGAGSAGSVVANRLSKKFKVLLLEAGGEPFPPTYIPTTAIIMLNRPFIDWQYKTMPQAGSCLAMKNKQCLWPRGKGLGGSSNTNFLIYTRGHRLDYDSWAKETGDSSWNYSSVLKHFKKSEDYEPFDGIWSEEMKKFHSKGGELKIKVPPYTGLADTFVEAVEEFGYPIVDINADYKEGTSVVPYTIKNGRRFGTFRAFIEPIRDRPNLSIYKFARVHKVLLSENKVAFGVEYERHGERKKAFATKEVIISGGAIGSPQILMLSGIGPKSHLKSLGIAVQADLPVGKNLQDHLTAFVGPFVINKPKSFYLERDLTERATYDFVFNAKGVGTSTYVQATTLFATSKEKKDALRSGRELHPDCQWILLGTNTYDASDSQFEHAFNLEDGILTQFFNSSKGKDSFQIINIIARPKSRGEILLNSIDPNADPKIYPNYFQISDDMDVLIESIKKSVDMVESTRIFRDIGARLSDTPFPGCEIYKFRTDKYWECYARSYSLTMYHPVGTCKMGRNDSKDSVVDSQLRVLGGIKGLRVVDASIMPSIVSANTNAASIMIGERGADFILKTWNEKAPS